MSALQPLALLLVCQLGGELIVRILAAPLPGAVVGCAMLFALLLVRGRMPRGLKTIAEGLLRYLPVMFVPAGVGVMSDAQHLRDEWGALLVTLVLSTAITIAATVWSFGAVARLVSQPHETDHEAR
ncbi:CidA/LrgA family protein [Azospirillum soli]|uniref:CidA/LrgA family protein n=1 Tax=Azospirillum soli TaxID=1304799 RepID=UPI001AEA913F|nr:CidA/LrgA family protein [Azospirillum soli]MBP2311804.1 holin-like protein [Azospirillum soli]